MEAENQLGGNTPLSNPSFQIIQLTDDLPSEQLVELRSFTSDHACQCLAHLAEVIQKIRQLSQYTLICSQDSGHEQDVHVLLHKKMSQLETEAIQILFEFGKGKNIVDETKKLIVEYSIEEISHH